MKITGHFSHPSCFSLHVLVVAMVLEELTSWKTDLLEWNPEVNGLLYYMMSLNHLAVCVFVNDVNMFSPSHVKICLFVLSAFLSGQWKIRRRSGEILSFCLLTSEETAAVPWPPLSPPVSRILAKTFTLNFYSRACYLGCTVFGTIPMIKSAQ